MLSSALISACLVCSLAYEVASQSAGSYGNETSIRVTVDTSRAIYHVEDTFLSYTVDSSVFQPNTHFHGLNFSSLKLHTLMRALSPAMLRIGGTSGDMLYFDKPLKVISKLHLLPNANVMTKSDLFNFVTLTRSTGTRLVFGLNLQLRFGIQWSPSNAIEILEYCSEMKICDSIDWELGNEPDWFDPKRNNFTTLTGQQISADFSTLKRLLSNYENCHNSAIIGPDVGRPSSSTGNPIFKKVANYSGDYLKGLTFHHYYFNGINASADSYTNPSHFSDLEKMIAVAKGSVAMTRNPNISLWLGETSDAYNSGTRDVSDRFVSGFLWLEKLGLSAAMGLKVVMRQTLVGGHYSLLDLNLDPNPDYWLSWLHKIFVGRSVFNVTLDGVGSPPAVRVYAHCTRHERSSYKAGALTVFALNVDRTNTAVLSFTGDLADQSLYLYLLEPEGKDGVLSKSVKLNGKQLVMPSDSSMPEPTGVYFPPKSQVRLPPLTFGFLVFPDANITLCKK